MSANPAFAGAASGRDTRPVILVESRGFLRQVVLDALRQAAPALHVSAVDSVATLVRSADDGSVAPADCLVLLCLPGGRALKTDESEIVQALSALRAWTPGVALAVLAEDESAAPTMQAVKAGVRGYIPMSASLEVVVCAIHLIQAGGSYVPALSLDAMLAALEQKTAAPAQDAVLFSPRQVSVARALRKGTPNKVIAYELNMCESTVKVHVRNIMKKLRATNRTQVAYLTNQYFSAEDTA